jgi:hypothetical protein
MTPEIIAKHLTPAKRRALLWLPTEGGRERMKSDPSKAESPRDCCKKGGLLCGIM